MLDDDDLERFARQVVLPDFGEENQLRLKACHVTIIGAGGLGTAVIQYLAAAGIGSLTIIDDDVIEPSNLNRQIIYTLADSGKSKAAIAKKAALALNPGVNITAIEDRFTPHTADAMLKHANGVAANIIADCSDNPETRYAVNEAAHRLGKVMVFGGAVRLEGQVSSFASGIDAQSPCFACLFPQAAGHDLAPRCSEAGILGSITGTIGTLMALEIMRQCLLPAKPLGENLIGQLLLFDGRYTELTRINTSPRNDCPVCGSLPR